MRIVLVDIEGYIRDVWVSGSVAGCLDTTCQAHAEQQQTETDRQTTLTPTHTPTHGTLKNSHVPGQAPSDFVHGSAM